ncbi:MAG: 4-(cytidine 5'-diphospho)-2-C-methyl-D-erythritol kinase, partial [bacterium]
MSAPLPAPVTVRACAKVNLYLRITGLRPDGFHDLLTIFQAIDLADTLEFACEAGRDTLNLRCTAPGMPDIEHNLIGRAYHLLQSRYGDQIHHPGVICRV